MTIIITFDRMIPGVSSSLSSRNKGVGVIPPPSWYAYRYPPHPEQLAGVSSPLRFLLFHWKRRGYQS